MRTLILFLFFINFAKADTELRLGSSFQSIPVGLQALSSVNAPNVNTLRNSFFVKTNRIQNTGFNFKAQLDQAFVDYATQEFRNANMQTIRVQENPERTEYTGSVTAEYEHDFLTSRFSLTTNLGNVLFPVRGAAVGQSFSFYNQATQIDWDYQWIEQTRPDDFFINRQLRTQKRSRTIETQRLSLGAEQTLSERYKVRLESLYQHKINERPPAFGFSLKQAYALSSALFFQLEGSRYFENKNSSLLNERGRFSAWVAKASMTTEPFVDWLLTLSYGLTLEQESFPDTGIVEQLGSDQYSMGVKYSWRTYSADIKGSVIRTNINTQSAQLEGGLTWQL